MFAVRRRMRGAHRVSYALRYGSVPEGKIVDHMCHVRHCVNPDHLRAVSHKQNHENRAGANTGNASGFRGVSIRPNGKWRAGVVEGNIQYYLGEYDTPEAANEVVKAKRLELFTHNDKDRQPV
jgi:HNH endonuclease/AP2 domain